MLEGCFDHFVIMYFHGIGTFKDRKEPEILLVWGEHSGRGEDILWQKESGANQAGERISSSSASRNHSL